MAITMAMAEATTTTAITSMDELALLHLLNLASPALPIGSYSWSQGLEAAVEGGWVRGEADLPGWMEGLLEQSLCRLDVPVLARCHRALAGADTAAFREWNDYALASRESRELQQEDLQTGAALLKLLRQLHPLDSRLPDTAADAIGLPAAFALAGVVWDISARATALGLLWSWAENQVAAGIKLIPLGQTAGQRVLRDIRPRIPPHLDRALARHDDDIGASLPGLALISAAHETQYCRLFRS